MTREAIEPQNWLQGAICIALPGMLGEIPVLFSFSELMSHMQPFCLVGYASLIGFAWFMSIKAGLQLTSASK